MPLLECFTQANSLLYKCAPELVSGVEEREGEDGRDFCGLRWLSKSSTVSSDKQ